MFMLWGSNEALFDILFRDYVPETHFEILAVLVSQSACQESRFSLSLRKTINTLTHAPYMLIFYKSKMAIFWDVSLYHHHHYHWLDSPTWTLAFLISFCQLKYPAIASSDFMTSTFSSVSFQPHAQPPVSTPEGRCFLSGLSPLAD
jgi:hypothetical protein